MGSKKKKSQKKGQVNTESQSTQAPTTQSKDDVSSISRDSIQAPHPENGTDARHDKVDSSNNIDNNNGKTYIYYHKNVSDLINAKIERVINDQEDYLKNKNQLKKEEEEANTYKSSTTVAVPAFMMKDVEDGFDKMRKNVSSDAEKPEEEQNFRRIHRMLKKMDGKVLDRMADVLQGTRLSQDNPFYEKNASPQSPSSNQDQVDFQSFGIKPTGTELIIDHKKRLVAEFSDDEKGAFYDEIVDFMFPYLCELSERNNSPVREGMNVLLKLLENHFVKYEEKKKKLMDLMNVKRLLAPTISLDLSAEIILAYNKMEEDDPLVAVFRLHPLIGEEIFKFGVFLDRYDTNKEVICSLVWSTIDRIMICLPQIGLNPYPICWECEKDFGTFTCSKCGVAKYCSKECQVESWKTHKSSCKDMEYSAKYHTILEFT